MSEIATYYWHEGVVYDEDGCVLERGCPWDEAQEKAQMASAFGEAVWGLSARIVKSPPPSKA
jgi:hypothetical protein